MGWKGPGFLGIIITGAAHGLKLSEMQPAFSNSHVFLSMKFWYLRGMGFGLHAFGGPMVGISISNRLVLSTSMEDLDMMLSNYFSSKEERLSLASCGMCAFCNITMCLLKLLCSGLKASFWWYS